MEWPFEEDKFGVSCPNYTQAHAVRQTGKLWRGLPRLMLWMKDTSSEYRKSTLSSCAVGAVVYALLLSYAHAATAASDPTQNVPPRTWVVDAAQNEIALLQKSDVYLRYRMKIVDQKGEQVRDVIESKDGTVARLILRDGRALTAEEDKAERERLDDMVASPGAYARHVKNDSGGSKLAAEMIRQMPDAMIYTYTPGQPQSGHDEGNGQVVLDYHPNPGWSPPSMAAEALTGLEGRVWIDVKTHQMLRMEGHIFKPVNFGWGMLAHIYPGGQLALEQTNAGQRRWIYSHFTQDISVRTLMVKTLNVHKQIDASGFQVLPGALTYQQAVQQLLDTPLPSH
jgi:hypothetical protein